MKESKRVLFLCSADTSSLATKAKQRNSLNSEATIEQSAGYPNFHECLDELKTLRLQVAEECDISPENIFNMATLREMSYSPPDTQTAFLAVTGVTESKWNKFRGDAFLEVTKKFCLLKRQFLSAQADTLVPHTATQPPPRRHTRGYANKSKYFHKGAKNKFVKNWRGKSSKGVSADITRAGVKTVSYTRAGSGSGSSSGHILAPPVPRRRN